MAVASSNYDYCLRTALALTSAHSPVVLDLGCGKGSFVALGRQAGVEVWGADTYAAEYQDRLDHLLPPAAPFLRQIEAGRLPYPDAHFDVIVCNQVIEHIPPSDLPSALQDARRVLKPSGCFLALFPAADVWFEGHLGVYGPHRLRRWPRLQWSYLWLGHALGFGYKRFDSSARWATYFQGYLKRHVFHHDPAAIGRLMQETFGTELRFLEPDYMRFRLGARVRHMPNFFLRLVCRKRVGMVFATAPAS